MAKGDKRVGRALKALRQRLGWSTTQAAYHADMSATYLSQVECGHVPLSDALLVRLVRRWHVTFEEIAAVQDAGKPKRKDQSAA